MSRLVTECVLSTKFSRPYSLKDIGTTFTNVSGKTTDEGKPSSPQAARRRVTYYEGSHAATGRRSFPRDNKPRPSFVVLYSRFLKPFELIPLTQILSTIHSLHHHVQSRSPTPVWLSSSPFPVVPSRYVLRYTGSLSRLSADLSGPLHQGVE